MAKMIKEQAKKIEKQDNRLQVVEDFIRFMKEQLLFSLTHSVDLGLFQCHALYSNLLDYNKYFKVFFFMLV